MAAEAPNRCDVVDEKAVSKPELTQLCMFQPPMNAHEVLARTCEYAKDPKAYMERSLGVETLKERQELLCISEEVDQDRYGTGSQKQHFEQHIAGFLGKKHGLYFITGVQAQLAAMKIHCQNAGNNRVAWHVSSHLESAEMGAYKELYGLERQLLGSDEWKLATVKDIKQVLEQPEDKRPAVVLLEIPNRVLGCDSYTFSELGDISAACKEAGVKLHMDGARLWDIEPHYREQASKGFTDVCNLFDTVYVSFYKGLGATAGAVITSDDEDFVKEAKVWQRRAGGNAFTFVSELIDCERGFNENIGTFAQKRLKMIEIADGVLAATKDFKTADGQPIVSFMPARPICDNVRTVFRGCTEEELVAARDKVQEKTNVRVFERLWPKKSLDDKMKAGEDVGKFDHKDDEGADDRRHIMEWLIMSVTEKIETMVFVDGYKYLCEELVAAQKAASK